MICDRGPKFDLNNSITLFKVPQRNVLQSSPFSTHVGGDTKAALNNSSILFPLRQKQNNPNVSHYKILEVVRR